MEASHNAIENTYSADSMKRLINKLLAQAYLPPCETSKMEPFMKLVKGWKLLIIFAESSIFDIW